jgi:hypothetical protein
MKIDILIHEMNITARSSIDFEKENLILHLVKYLEQQFSNQEKLEGQVQFLRLSYGQQ